MEVGRSFSMTARGCFAAAICIGLTGAAQAEWSFGVLPHYPNRTAHGAHGVNANGTKIVGSANAQGQTSKAVVWTLPGGAITALPVPNNQSNASAWEISRNGKHVCGTIDNKPAKWDLPANQYTLLGLIPDYTSGTSMGISDDGMFVAGTCFYTSQQTTYRQAYRWSQTAGMVGLGDLPGGTTYSVGRAISGDGSTVTGMSTSGQYYNTTFKWTPNEGMIGIVNSSNSTPYHVNVDGSAITGVFWWSQEEGGTAERPLLWTPEHGAVVLRGLRGSYLGYTLGMDALSDNMKVGVGWMFDDMYGSYPRLWSLAGGFQPLPELLSDHGFPQLMQWQEAAVEDISADGTTIIGSGRDQNGVSQAWYAKVEVEDCVLLEPLAVPARATIIGGNARSTWLDDSHRWRRTDYLKIKPPQAFAMVGPQISMQFVGHATERNPSEIQVWLDSRCDEYDLLLEPYIFDFSSRIWRPLLPATIKGGSESYKDVKYSDTIDPSTGRFVEPLTGLVKIRLDVTKANTPYFSNWVFQLDCLHLIPLK